jgi:lysophospholipase L1-like esterase
MKRYVALGSSMAAGPGIQPRAAGAPRWSGRSARNYAHLVAGRLNLEPGVDFVDVTFSGATTAHVLTDHQHGRPPQITALDGTEGLVTVTIGGNDVGYVPLLMAASLPRAARCLPLLGGRISELLDRDTRDRALAAVFDSLCAVGHALQRRAPDARIFFVDYLTILPSADAPAPPLSEGDADLGRHVAATLERLTADAAAATGCEVVRAAAASRQHHAWSAEPWTTTPTRYGLPLLGRPAPLHPNGPGMRAVADLVVAQL